MSPNKYNDISLTLSNFWTQSGSYHFFIIPSMSVGPVVMDPSFDSNISNACLLFLGGSLGRGLPLLKLVLSKNHFLALFVFLYLISVIFIDFCSDFYYSFSSYCFRLKLFFFQFPKMEAQIIDFRSFLSSNICI